MLTTIRKNVVGDSSGKTMVQNRRIGLAPSMAAGLDHALRDRLQAGEEEQEIVADLLPDRDDHDEDHGVRAVEHRIPVDARAAAAARASMPSAGWNMKNEEHAGDRGRHRIGPDQKASCRPARPADVAVGHDVANNRPMREREERHQRRKDHRDADRLVIFRAFAAGCIILEPDEFGSRARTHPARRNDCCRRPARAGQ